MLRAAKRIDIQIKTFQNYDGFLLAPVIDINGLILSAEQTIDPRIKTFIESKGGKINRVKINGELLVRLTGDFNITHQEITDFIRESTTTGDVLPATVENQSLLPQFAAMIDRDMQAEKAKGTALTFSYNGCRVHLQRSVTESGSDTNISIGRDIKSESAAGFSEENILYTSRSNFMCGGRFDGFRDVVPVDVISDGTRTQAPIESGISQSVGISVGYMGALYAKRNISLIHTHSTSIENQLVSSMEVLSLQGGENGNLKLEMDRSVEWLNNPYPEQFNGDLKHTPGKVRLG